MEISKQKVMRTMDKLGYAESTVGTRYIRQAVEIAAKAAHAMMTKDIYPEIARKNGVTAYSAERAMRTATDKARRSPSWDYEWREIGGWNDPTNAEVIFRLVRECYSED